MSGNPVKIKLCGLSRPVDIDSVNEARPDYCGFIINVPKSIRNTTPDQVRALRKNLFPQIIPVGVFRNEPVETVAELLLDGTIGVAQLHGNEDEDYIRRLRTYGTFFIIQAFRVPVPEESSGIRTRSPENPFQIRNAAGPGIGESPCQGKAAFEPTDRSAENAFSGWADRVNQSSADLVLLDNGGGGTGKTFEWTLANQIQRPFLLAGGIGPENITEALDQLHPWGVDMSSSVETDGKKDREKMLAAVSRVREWNMAHRESVKDLKET
ncbi:MAG: phosphoribosylanthranilate isomerase [Lachnospiraceae bacterium]|nr:phosphoribosylanthranilate isomerase [Lachnospiraceae bacterium]